MADDRRRQGSAQKAAADRAAAQADTAQGDLGKAGQEQRAALLSWYDQRARQLPWRENQDPYRVWISEIMLQQTRVETVIPYYLKFLERFPEVGALASASVDEVLALWSGLGYYRRARQLHAAAQEVVRRGEFPADSARLQELPGIGPYTAAAVASIAFGEAVPVVDGNVERVTARLEALETDPKRAAGRAVVRRRAGDLVDPQRPGDSNQALMELGATVCVPRNPRCGECPLALSCVARRRGNVESYPVKRERRAPVAVFRCAAVVVEGDRVLLFQRPQDSELLAGTWEIPWVEEGSFDPLRSAEKRSVAKFEKQLEQRYGGRWKVEQRWGRIRHSITHRALTVEVFGARLESAPPTADAAEGPACRWLRARELPTIATSSLVTKILDAAGFGASGGLFDAGDDAGADDQLS